MGDTVLINMPFYTVHAPNLEIGLLKSLLNQSGVETVVKYYNLLYLKETGDYGSYVEIMDSPVEVLYSDWLVSDELVLGKRFADSEYLEYAKQNGLSDNLSKLHPQMRESLVKFIRRVIESDDLCDLPPDSCTTSYVVAIVKTASGAGGRYLSELCGRNFIIFLSPRFNQYLCFSQGGKDLPIEEFIPQLPVKRFNISILPGTPG